MAKNSKTGALIYEKRSDADYVLKEGQSAWITVGDKAIYITNEKVEVYYDGREFDDPIGHIRL